MFNGFYPSFEARFNLATAVMVAADFPEVIVFEVGNGDRQLFG